MKKFILVILLVISNFATALAAEEKPVQVSALEILNILFVPMQEELQKVDNFENAKELQKFIDFMGSGNKITRAEKTVKSSTETVYMIDNVDETDCGGASGKCRGSYYILIVKLIDGKRYVQSLRQNH